MGADVKIAVEDEPWEPVYLSLSTSSGADYMNIILSKEEVIEIFDYLFRNKSICIKDESN